MFGPASKIYPSSVTEGGIFFAAFVFSFLQVWLCQKFIHRVSLHSALKEITAKRSSPMDAAFHSFRNDTVPREPGVLYQDSV